MDFLLKNFTFDLIMKKTPLHALHLEYNAQMVEFSGYEMPVRYPLGILKEHLHTRENAGLFDVAHMGSFLVKGQDIFKQAERFIPTDLQALPKDHQTYTVLLNEQGGIIDDLIVGNHNDEFLEVTTNAGRKDLVIDFFQNNIDGEITSHFESHSLLALQGPKAAEVMAKAGADVEGLYFMQGRPTEIYGNNCWVTRTGYTGEDGFEILGTNNWILDTARKLLAHEEVELIGLGARDSLRLEAGLCLYGHDINEETTPVEAGLNFVISKSRREAANFNGAERILAQIKEKPGNIRVGLLPEGRAPIREGTELFVNGKKIGYVTSGAFSPSLQKPIAMGYVERQYRETGTAVTAVLRGREIPCTITKMPFITPNYRRK